MSFFDDQMDDWFANDCKGSPSDYYAGEIGPWVEPEPKPRTEAQKARKKRSRARRRAKQLAQAKQAQKWVVGQFGFPQGRRGNGYDFA